MPLIAKCFAQLWLNSETFFAKFNHFKLAHILHSRRTLRARFFNGQMPTGNKTWKMWAVTLCLSCPHPEYVCSINDCQTLHWTTKTVEGVGQLLGAVTDGRASLLFLKLGEFFPGSVIRILMVLVSWEMEPLAQSPGLLGVIWSAGGCPTSHYSKTSSHSMIIFMRNFQEQNLRSSCYQYYQTDAD